jgi:hypothetical protein
MMMVMMTKSAHSRHHCNNDFPPHQHHPRKTTKQGFATVTLWQILLVSNIFFVIGLTTGLFISLYSPLRILLDESFVATTIARSHKRLHPPTGFSDESASSPPAPQFLKPCLWYHRDMSMTKADNQTDHSYQQEQLPIQVTTSYGTVEGTTFIVKVAESMNQDINPTLLYQCGRHAPLRTTILSINNHHNNNDNNNSTMDYSFQFHRVDCAPNHPLTIPGSSHTCPSLNPGQHRTSETMGQLPQHANGRSFELS